MCGADRVFVRGTRGRTIEASGRLWLDNGHPVKLEQWGGSAKRPEYLVGYEMGLYHELDTPPADGAEGIPTTIAVGGDIPWDLDVGVDTRHSELLDADLRDVRVNQVDLTSRAERVVVRLSSESVGDRANGAKRSALVTVYGVKPSITLELPRDCDIVIPDVRPRWRSRPAGARWKSPQALSDSVPGRYDDENPAPAAWFFDRPGDHLIEIVIDTKSYRSVGPDAIRLMWND